jgi:hypothetical protein
MLKFLVGVLIGVVLSVGFVRYGWAPPGLFSAPKTLQNNLVATAIEEELYDLDVGASATRALEVYFANRAGDAVALDAENGHPFLRALHQRRAQREARQLLATYAAYDKVLAQPALRAALVRKHGIGPDAALKRAMLGEDAARYPYLSRWLVRENGEVSPDELIEHLRATARAAISKQ